MTDIDHAVERDVMEYDVVTVGAGPAVLAFAIRLKQLNPDLSVCVIEKGATVGAHILSGAVIEPGPLGGIAGGSAEFGDPGETAPLLDARLMVEHLIALRPDVRDQLANLPVDLIAEYEPKVDRRLLRLEQVVLLPHLGSATQEGREAMGLRAILNLEAFFSGTTPPDLVR